MWPASPESPRCIPTTSASGITARDRLVSPLGRGAALALLGTVVVISAVGFAAVLLLLWLAPQARAHFLSVVAFAVPVMSLAVLAGLHLGLGRAGTGWRELGFVRPRRRMLHLAWQLPGILAVLLVVQVVVFVATGVEPTPRRSCRPSREASSSAAMGARR